MSLKDTPGNKVDNGREDKIRVGLTVQNFAPSPKVPSIQDIVDYAQRAESLGYDSLWAFDHLLLGSKNPFPFLDSLSVLAALAVSTKDIRLGTGVLIPTLRNPVSLAKMTSTIDRMSGGRLTLGVASGWYRKEFDAVGIDFGTRGTTLEKHLRLIEALWGDEEVNMTVEDMILERVVMLPNPQQKPGPPVLMGGYVDHVLKRVATMSDGWLTYFYKVESFVESWKKVRQYAAEAGRDPDELMNAAQVPICIGDTYEEARERSMAFLKRNFDEPEWSHATFESAICGTSDQCIEKMADYFEAGVQHLILVPCEYDEAQVDAIARSILPALRQRL